jgi:hypothetical protein
VCLVPVSPFVPLVSVCLRRKALDVPFYRYKGMAQLYNGV